MSWMRRGPRSPKPETIDYTCKRCALVLPSLPLPTDLRHLQIYGLPEGWELASGLSPLVVLAPSEDDYCLCKSCMTELRRGAPLDMRDLGRMR